MTEPQDALTAEIRARDEAMGDPFAWDRSQEEFRAAAAVALDDRRILLALVRTPETLDGTTTDCPLEGVHEHAFRGPHRFHEWDPSSYFTLNDRPPVRTLETLDDDDPEAWRMRTVKPSQSPTPPEGLRERVDAVADALNRLDRQKRIDWANVVVDEGDEAP